MPQATKGAGGGVRVPCSLSEKPAQGTSPVVQWLRLSTPKAGALVRTRVEELDATKSSRVL